MGSIALREKLLLYPAKRVRGLQPGPVGVVFQSGGTFQFWLQQAALRGLDFSYAISSGNELDLDLADYINFLVDDEHTKIIVCLVEGIRRPQAFMAAAEKALAAGKPILHRQGRAQRARQGGGGEPHRRDRGRRSGVRRGLPEIRHRALSLARRPHGNRARLRPGPPAEGQPHRHGLLFGRRQGPRARLRRRRRRRDGAAHARDPGEAARHDRCRARRRKSVGRRPDGRRAGGQVRRNLQGGLRRSDGRSRHRAGPDAGQSRRSLQPGAAAQRARFDRQAGAGLRADRAERLRGQPQISERNWRSVHPRPARNRAGVAGAGPLRRGAAARRRRDAGAARARRKSGRRGL